MNISMGIVLSELQSSVDQLLGEKMQLCEQVEVLKKEKEELKEQVQKMLCDITNVILFGGLYSCCQYFYYHCNSLQLKFRRKRPF